MNQDKKWKADGGFKSGYVTYLEKQMAEIMPSAGLSSTNIESRLGYLKKRFNALLEIRQKGSGFGWDDTLKMVTGDRKLFQEWATSHKDARGMYRKPFPLFDSLEDIYSKDRATGLNAALSADRDDLEINQEVIQEVVQDSQEFNPIEVDEIPTEASGSVSKKRAADGSSSRSSSKKNKKNRKNQDITDIHNSLQVKMGKMLESSNAQIAQLTTMLEGPKNVKAGLREELGKVGGISRSNILTLCVKMTEDEVVIFRELVDDDEKYEFLAMILDR